MTDQVSDAFDMAASSLGAPRARPGDVETQRVLLRCYERLSIGEPVTPDSVAADLAIPPDRVRAALGRVPVTSLEFDDRDRIVGIGGLSLKPTRHRVTIRGRSLFTWCAFDTLFAPEILGVPVTVASTCPASDTPIRLTVTPKAVTRIEPETAVLSFVTPDAEACCAGIRDAFCRHVNFFASREVAEDRRTEDMLILSVAEGFRLGRVRNCSAFGAILFS